MQIVVPHSFYIEFEIVRLVDEIIKAVNDKNAAQSAPLHNQKLYYITTMRCNASCKQQGVGRDDK
jgi:hypothetical protein